MNCVLCLAVIILTVASLNGTWAINHVPAQEWSDFKDMYQKQYPTAAAEALAQYYYAYNKRMIENHNNLYERGQRTFKLKTNQFSDMRLVQFNALFPSVTPPTVSHATPGPDTLDAAPSYNPSKNFGYMFNVENQGTKCNSGWAYAAVKAVEILQAQQDGDINPQPLSAQNIIDCAGGARACKSQVPQTAFDYLTQYGMDLLTEGEYGNNNTQNEPGMCVPRGTLFTNLAQYSTIPNGDDEALKRFLSAGFPVVVEFNPASFEFMHYSEGIFQPPNNRNSASHFMVVIGYDSDEKTGTDYWLIQNSFDTTWGEQGILRLRRDATIKLAKNAIFPSQLGRSGGQY
ncbi:cathepsin L-like peptidase [Musca autumnalis]|uniref:cathepsin L-like peptidase n=1 Tax=Musca autumnalis TaxID=221902 RepID=UPI003CF5CA20